MALLGVLFFLWRQWPDQQLHLIVCNVGQGDAILITQGFNQVLVDGGPDQRVLNCLQDHLPFWDRRLELVVLTHPEADHLTGLISVINHYQVANLAINDFGKQTPVFRRLAAAINNYKIRHFQPRRGMKIRLGLMDFDVVWPDNLALQERQAFLANKPRWFGFPVIQDRDFNANDYSITLWLHFGRFTALLTGDLSRERSLPLVWRQEMPPAQVLKVPHHGSRDDNPPALYQAVRSKIALISVGPNHFGQPSPQLLTFLHRQGIAVWRTDRNGTIELISNGQGRLELRNRN